jgi:iron complex outermembrane receptor protein
MLKGVALATVSALAFSVSAYAQDSQVAAQPADQGDLSNPEIIVTARRRDEDIQQVPMVVNAVTADQIQKLNMRDFNEVQNLVPGLQFFSNSNGIAAGAQLRGIQYDPNAGVNPSVAFYLNDAPIEPSLVLQSMYDIGQVEVLRGPQGTLRGAATPSGSIVVTTHRPDLNEAGGYVSLTANDIGTQNINGGVNVPIINGIAAIRIAGLYNDGEGNHVRTIERDGDHRDPRDTTSSGRVSILIEPADFLRLSGSAQTMHHTTRAFDQYASFSLFNPSAPASNPVITPSEDLSIQEFPRNIDQNFKVYNWRAEVRAAGQVLIYQGEKTDLDVHAKTNTDYANFLNGVDTFQNTHTHADGYVHEIRLQNEERVEGVFDYVVGYFHSLSKPSTDLTTQTPITLPPFLGGRLLAIATTPISIPQISITEESFFGNLTAHIGDATEISGGARHIKFRNPGAPLVIAGTATPGVPINDDGTIFITSLKHQFSDNFMAYASFGTSRRPGAFAIGDFSAVKSPLQTSFQNLKTETSKSFEAGVKATLFDGHGHANLTVYHQKFDNYPYRSATSIYYVNNAVTVSPGGVVTITPTVGNFNFVASVPVEVNGVEGEFNVDVTPHWNIGLIASYSLGKIKNGLIPCNDFNKDGVPDNVTAPPTLAQLQAAVGSDNVGSCVVTQRSSYQPPFSATLQTEYHQPIAEGVDGFGRGLFTLNGAAQGDPQFAYDQVDAYGLVNLFLGIRDPKGMWELSLFGKNLFDVDKATTVNLPATTSYQQLSPPTFRTTIGQTFTSPYTQISTTPEREFGLNFRFSFGSR